MRRKYSHPAAAITRRLLMALLCSSLASCITLPHGFANPQGDVHFKKGLQLSLKKQWPQAEAEYRKAIALDPKDATYRSYLADALAAQGKFDKAQDSYEQSDKIKKSTPQPAYQKPPTRRPPSTRTPAARPPSARSGSTTSPTTKPRAPRTGTSTSSTTTSRTTPGTVIPIPDTGDDNGGDDATTVTTNGDEPVTFVLPDGRTVTVTGRSGQTITIPVPKDTTTNDRVTVTSSDPADTNDDPHYIKGLDLMDEDKWAQAEVEFRAALKSRPTNTEYWDTLGNVLYKQSKWQEAEKAHRTAVKLEPEESYFHAQLALDLLKLGRRDEANNEARQAIRLGLQDHEVFDELGLHVNVQH